jgi:hypothetical protein
MLDMLAKSYMYENGKCYIDGVLQSSTESCTSASKFLFSIFAIIFIPLMAIAIFFLIFWIVMLAHAIKHQDLKDRTVWLIALLASFVFGFSWLVSAVYYFAVKRPYDISHKYGNEVMNQNIPTDSDSNVGQTTNTTNV